MICLPTLPVPPAITICLRDNMEGMGKMERRKMEVRKRGRVVDGRNM